MKKIVLLLFVLTLVFGCRSTGVTKPDGDTSKYRTIVVKDFSLEGAAIQENEDLKAFANGLPKKFSGFVKNYVEAYKIADKVVLASSGAKVSGDYLVIEGSFTKITAGSTAARILVGFGAGASTVGAKWDVKDGRTGEVLSSFERNKHTSSGYRGAQAVNADAEYLAKDLAKLLKKMLQ